MKRAPTLWLLLSWPLVIASACGAPASSGSSAPSGLGSDPDGCRTVAMLTGVDVGDERGELRCGFDVASSEHRCELSLAGARAATITEYASLADFVEAGHTVGKRTSLVETRVEQGQTHRLSHAYDELGRLVRSVDEARGRTILTHYFDYDDRGRPRRATSEIGGASEAGCGEWLEAIDYGDASRTVSHRSRSRHPERCGFGERTLVERYDGAGNRISAVSADAAGIGESFAAQLPTATERLCL